MKKTLISVALAGLFGLFVNAQRNQEGVYLNQSDFEKNRLSYVSNPGTEKIKIHFNEFLDKPFITVNQNGEKSTFFKDEIFAYRHNGNVVRTWNIISYNFLERGDIWIYSKDENVSLGKGIKRERKYYYSVTGKGEILALTILNLKRSFPDKHQFHNFLDTQFRNDAELSRYDSYENKFKINHILAATIFSN